MDRYNHQQIESKWQKVWDDKNLYLTDTTKITKNGNMYLLDMFPYPSGDGLHMGHTEGYSATDIYYRYKRMQGYNVLHPQGFDSFGLPAENYAIKTGTHPSETTKTNGANYLRQWSSLGLGHDFRNIFYTSDPEYYTWTQWLFGEFYKNDLAYKKIATVNWCDSCNTILANEQVEDGVCERCKSEVVQKAIPAWFFRITDFADDLITDLDTVDWPEATKKKQVNWIGKSEGAEIDFKVKCIAREDPLGDEIKDSEDVITVFTTRADTLFGVTYVVLAPEHALIQTLSSKVTNIDEVQAYIDATAKKTELDRLENKEKTGVQLEGIVAINPANNQEIPVYTADYALANYATGAVMAVPAHDERDFEFATKFNLPIKEVVAPHVVMTGEQATRDGVETLVRRCVDAIIEHPIDDTFFLIADPLEHFVGGGTDGEDELVALEREIIEESGFKNFEILERVMEYSVCEGYRSTKNKNQITDSAFYHVKLKDLEQVESEIEQGNHTARWVKRSEVGKSLKWSHHKVAWDKLNEGKVYTDSGLVRNSGNFNNMSSEKAKREITENVGGRLKSTYRLRDWSISRQRYWGCPIPMVYDPEGNAHFVGQENLPWLLPTDVDFVPVGTPPLEKSQELKDRVTSLFGEGWTPEYDTMDTFVDSSWYFLRYPDMHNTEEFCSKAMLEKWQPVDLYIGGAEHTYMHLLYARFFVKALKKIGLIDFKEPFKKLRHQGMVNDKEGKKMSKSKGNIVNPDDMVERFGADAVRTYMMFAAPLEDDVIWNEDNIVGVYRFLEKVWALQDKVSENLNDEIEKELHKVIKAVGEQIEDLKYNTAVSDMMKFVNMASKQESLTKDQLFRFVQLLAPYAPHITDEIAERLGFGLVLESEWPTYSADMLVEDSVTIGVQVNGKRRGDITVVPDAKEEEVLAASQNVDSIRKWLDEGSVRKVIYIPGKILNIIVG